jgi:phosphopantothenoylcysteine decarboxylase/phosphopantothenate--cysteine ligase
LEGRTAVRPFDGRRILLVVTGGIAAYKSAYLTRRLIEAGAVVDVVLTHAAQYFIGKTTFEGLTGRPVHTSTWDRPMAHLDLGKEADAAVVAPATAEFLSRMACGGAGDLASAVLLAASCPVLVCPAMNSRMWEHPATRRNMDMLREFGAHQVGPEHGELAEGEEGPGRMSEPEDIVAALGRLLEPDSALAGNKVVVTAGPTRADIDPVRFIGNRSSGRMGFALGASAWRRGAEVVVIAGPGHAARPRGPEVIEVETADQMLAALVQELEDASVLMMAAAVGDFAPAVQHPNKIKKGSAQTLDLSLLRGPDLLTETAALRTERGIISLGFALETDAPIENAERKLEDKALDFIAVNLANEPGSGFATATNRVTLLDRWGDVEELPLLLKEELAERILDRMEERLAD